MRRHNEVEGRRDLPREFGTCVEEQRSAIAVGVGEGKRDTIPLGAGMREADLRVEKPRRVQEEAIGRVRGLVDAEVALRRLERPLGARTPADPGVAAPLNGGRAVCLRRRETDDQRAVGAGGGGDLLAEAEAGVQGLARVDREIGRASCRERV